MSGAYATPSSTGGGGGGGGGGRLSHVAERFSQFYNDLEIEKNVRRPPPGTPTLRFATFSIAVHSALAAGFDSFYTFSCRAFSIRSGSVRRK
jgi:hypothetical protein